jgi:hypothetical protein
MIAHMVERWWLMDPLKETKLPSSEILERLKESMPTWAGMSKGQVRSRGVCGSRSACGCTGCRQKRKRQGN